IKQLRPMQNQHPFRILWAALPLLALSAWAGNCPETPIDNVYHEPSYGSAVVDGAYNEWNLATDYFASTYVAGDTDKPQLGNVYLRYDCAANVVNVLVLSTNPEIYPVLAQDADAWASLGGDHGKVYTGANANSGGQPNFAWIGVGYDEDPGHAL